MNCSASLRFLASFALASLLLPANAAAQSRASTVIPGMKPSATSVSYAYVANPSTDTVSVIDPTTHSIVKLIAVGDKPAGIAVHSKSHRAFVANTNSDTVTVFDTQNNVVVGAPIAVTDQPGAIAVSPNGQRLYVASAPGVVQAIDLKSGNVAASTLLAAMPTSLAVTPDGKRLFVAWSGLSVLDTSDLSLVQSLTPGSFATHVALSNDGTRAYVSVTNYNFGGPSFSASGALVIYDTNSYAQVGSIFTGSLPGMVAFSPDGNFATAVMTATWVDTGYGAGFLSARHVVRIALSTNSITGYIDVAKTASAVAFDATSSEILATVPGTNSVAVIPVTASALSQSIPVVGGAASIAVSR